MTLLPKYCLLALMCIAAQATAKNKPATIKKYYEQINTAEISICRGDLTAAAASYGRAYKLLGNRMTSLNLYNYFIVSARLNRQSECVLILKELQKRGWDSAIYKRDMAKYFSKEKTAELCALYTQTSNIPVQLDSVYIKKIDSLVAIDQKQNKYLRSINNGLLDGASGIAYNNITRANIECLKTLFADKFPADRILGREGMPYCASLYSVILIHNAEGYNDHTLDELLYEGVLNGDVQPSCLASHITGHNMYDVKEPQIKLGNATVDLPLIPYDFMLVNDSLFEYPIRDSIVAVCNKNRKGIPGLDKAEEFREKIIYHFYHPEYTFINTNYIVPVDRLPARVKKLLVYVPRPRS